MTDTMMETGRAVVDTTGVGGGGRAATATLAGNRSIQRYVDDVIELNDRLSFGRLPEVIDGEPLYLGTGTDDDLITLTVRDHQLPARYRKGILGFRLAQYLRLGWISNDLVHQRALYCEPEGGYSVLDDIHTVTLRRSTGRIVGYIGLVGSLDPEPMPLESPRRSRFPTETAHHVEVVSRFARPGLTSHQVYEIKRFVRIQRDDDGPWRARVPWHLIHGLGCAVVALGDGVRVLLGDSKEHGALRHFRMIGFDPVVTEGTKPSLPCTELMWPSYTQAVNAKPFAALIPDELPGWIAAIGSALLSEAGLASDRALLAALAASRRERPARPVIPGQRQHTDIAGADRRRFA
jgi:hypothetical protein